jgi:hypothetical protein
MMERAVPRAMQHVHAIAAVCAMVFAHAVAQPVVAQNAGLDALSNQYIRVELGPRGLLSVTDLVGGSSHRILNDDFAVIVDDQSFDPSALRARREHHDDRVTYSYEAGDYRIRVIYELRADWHFVSKQIAIGRTDSRPFHVKDITLFRGTLAETPSDDFVPQSARPNLQTADYGATMRFPDGRALLVVAQNPFLHFTRDGARFMLRYAPDLHWNAADGEFMSDRGLIEPVKLSGRRIAAHMTPEWRMSPDTTPGMDEAEVSAFTGMVRSLFIYERTAPINVFVGWTANDYQIDVGTPEGRAEYRRVFDQASAVGAQYVLYAPSNSLLSRREESVDDWSWEHVLWLGLGQKIRKGDWDPRTSEVPASIREMVDYAAARKLKLLAYVYPVMPFSQNPSWLVPVRNDPNKKAASLGNRAFQDWLIDELVAFHDRTGIAGFSFDYTFLTYDGSSRYAQWYGWRRVMQELRRRIPDVVIDGRQAYHLYGPWTWLAGSYPHPTFNDEQPESFIPYPDLHFDRVSADRERYTAYRYRNYEFAPTELVPGFMTHQTSRSDETGDMPSKRVDGRGIVLTSYRARDWDYLGWRYSVLSSIAVAGWNNVLSMLPARDSAENASFRESDRAWLRSWLDWTVAHKELLRHTKTILGQPALGKVDGTSAIDGDHGFVFLFNPDARPLDARVAIDSALGLTHGGRFTLREVYPVEGMRIGKAVTGTWQRGDTARITLDGGSALVFEVTPAPSVVTQPTLFGATGDARLENGVLEVTGVRGEPGTHADITVLLPHGASVHRTRVNGIERPYRSTPGGVAIDVTFAGQRFRQMQPVVLGDSSFTGGRIRGTFTIPKRIFDQLGARRRAWPINWTAEDFRTTWLAPERLLLYVQIAEPDDRWEASLKIDGRTVELRKAYSAVRAEHNTFVGFYADVSLLDPDRTYTFDLELPMLEPAQFRGVFFENIEPEYTTSIKR